MYTLSVVEGSQSKSLLFWT